MGNAHSMQISIPETCDLFIDIHIYVLQILRPKIHLNLPTQLYLHQAHLGPS